MSEQILYTIFQLNINTLQCVTTKKRKKKNIMFTLICWSIQWTLRSLTIKILLPTLYSAERFADECSFIASEKACVLSTFDCNICIYYHVLRGMDIWFNSFKRAMQHMLCCALFLLMICISHFLESEEDNVSECVSVCLCLSIRVCGVCIPFRTKFVDLTFSHCIWEYMFFFYLTRILVSLLLCFFLSFFFFFS